MSCLQLEANQEIRIICLGVSVFCVFFLWFHLVPNDCITQNSISEGQTSDGYPSEEVGVNTTQEQKTTELV